MLVQQHVDYGEQESDVGLWLDRDPFGRGAACNGEMRLDLHPLHAAVTRIGVALNAANAARRLDIGAEREHVLAQRRVWRDRESAVPQFAVEMLRMRALHALAGAKAHVDRAPGTQKRRQRSHVGRRRSTTAEARCNARIAGFVGQAGRARGIELFRHHVERLIPRDRHEARILTAPLLRVGAFHRRQYTVGRIGLLHQAERLDAHLAPCRVDRRRIEVRGDLGGDIVLDTNLHKVWASDALVAVCRDSSLVMRRLASRGFGRHGVYPTLPPARLAAFAFRRSIVLPTSTTKRPCVPLQIGSISSLADTSNETLRPSKALTVTVISTDMPSKVGARCLMAMSVPTESSPASPCC